MTKKKSPAALLEQTGLNSLIARQRIVTLKLRIIPHAFKNENFNRPTYQELAQANERLVVLMVRLSSQHCPATDVIPLNGRTNVRAIH